jgi:large subunit ribosomal protein L21
MYAIVEIAGQQFKVEKDQKYFVHQLEGKPGSKVTFENVLLLDDKGKVSVGAPAVNGVQVTAKIEQHLLGDKVIVFKKKRRKGYKVKNGHRQRLTEITVQEIGKKATPNSETKAASIKAAPKPEAKAAPKKAAPKKAAPKKAAPKSEEKAAPKKAASIKTAPKKVAAKSKTAVASKTKKES